MDVAGKYAGLTFGAIRRNSTARQRGNYRSQKQLITVEEHVTRNGGRIVLYDEQGTSGRRLAGRPVAQSLLADLAVRLVDGIAVDVLDRLTRDELGIDAGVIAQALVKARGVLVTTERDYRLWQRTDLLIYRILTGLAGAESLGIRDNNWDGLFRKAQLEPFFMGLPPFGYATIAEDTPLGGPDSPRRLRRRPVRDEALAPFFAALEHAFDTCLNLGEVAAKLNREGHAPPRVRGTGKGRPIPWETRQLRTILRNPIYHGEWAFCWQSKRDTPIWDAPSTDGARRRESFSLHVPALQWFTRARMEAWRATFLISGLAPATRNRTWDNPLRGVFLCSSCQQPLMGQGHAGYGCASKSLKTPAIGCAHPQHLGREVARRLLREALPSLLAERADYHARLTAQLGQVVPADRREKRREDLVAGLAQMQAQWTAPDSPYIVPAGIAQRMSDLQREINTLDEALAREAQRPQLNAQDHAILANVAMHMERWWEGLTDDEEYGLLRRAFADVIVDAGGWGKARWWRIVSRTNRLLNG